MPARDLNKLIEIKTPCTADWNSMIGNDRIRLCEHCNLSVNDLSQLTPKRVRRLVTKSNGRLCIRYKKRPDGSPIIKAVPAKLHSVGRRVSKIAAGAFTATLSLSSVVAHSAPGSLQHEHVFASQHIGSLLELLTFGSSIKGTVRDPVGAVIPGAEITLGTAEMSSLSKTTTDDAGEYRFDGLQPGTYSLTIEVIGFTTNKIVEVTLSENETQNINSSLEVAGETTVVGGAVMVLPSLPLIAAAWNDDLERLQSLLTRENVNHRDESLGTTVLEHAVRNGNREMVQLVLGAGADVNTRNESKETPLMMLGEQATADIVWDLINAGAKLELKDEEGDTALINAATEKNLPVLTALLHAGAKVEVRNNEGQTPLMVATSNDQRANIKALIRAGADMNARDKEGKTALDYAIQEGNEKTIKLLQSYGAVTGEKPKEN